MRHKARPKRNNNFAGRKTYHTEYKSRASLPDPGPKPPLPPDATPGERRHRACGSKIPYQSEYTATNAATVLGWASGAVLSAYRCPYCSTPEAETWHIGHPR